MFIYSFSSGGETMWFLFGALLCIPKIPTVPLEGCGDFCCSILLHQHCLLSLSIYMIAMPCLRGMQLKLSYQIDSAHSG